MDAANDLSPDGCAGAVVLSVAHAGRDYDALAELARVPLSALVALEDRYADLLPALAIARGRPCLLAERPRAWIDLNRDETDLDPTMIANAPRRQLSARARHGLGLIPSRLPAIGPLWRRPLERAELAARLADYRRFHQKLHAMVAAAQARTGTAILLDLHSMPPLDATPAPDIVIGDRFGRAASPWLVEAIERWLRGQGLTTAINRPYAGGAIIASAGDPMRDCHAVQLEFSRALYLDPTLGHPGPGLVRVQGLIANLADRLDALIADRIRPAAAQ